MAFVSDKNNPYVCTEIYDSMKIDKGLIALSPLLVFLGVYLITSLCINDFYKMPISVAFLISSVYAVAITRGKSINKRIEIFSEGASEKNIVLMIWIFILAGAFAQAAKTMGAIDAAVNLTLSLLPGNLLLAGIFVASCFVSFSIGTSVGTIVALTPVAVGIAEHTGIEIPFIVAVVTGGAFFGDNLSFISDTTIAATRTQGCTMRDKFKVNFQIVVPAAAIVFLIYVFAGADMPVSESHGEIEWLKIVPYLAVIGCAMAGINVATVLIIGIVLCAVIGLYSRSFDFFGCAGALGEGITGMGELIIITLMAGGMLEMIRVNGGIDYIIRLLTRNVSSKRGGELSIALLVSLTNCCTANNTVAIITVGSIAKKIAGKYGIDPRKAASILDTFSCLVQGIIPYGAQILMASELAGISPLSIIKYLYYPFLMGAFACLSILFRFPRKYS